MLYTFQIYEVSPRKDDGPVIIGGGIVFVRDLIGKFGSNRLIVFHHERIVLRGTAWMYRTFS